MKKNLRQLIVLMFIFTLLFSTNVFASGINSNYSKATKAAKSLLDSYNPNDNLNDPIKLYDFDNNETALLYPIRSGGYIIVDLNDYSIPEYSFNDNNFLTDKTKKYIYCGPLNYFEDNNGKIIDLKTKSEIKDVPKVKEAFLKLKKQTKSSKNNLFDIENLKPTIKSNSNTMAISNTGTSYTDKTINTRYAVPAYSYNPNGICGSTAVAMLLRHYQQNYMNDLIPQKLISGDGVDLIKSLVPLVQLDGEKALNTSIESSGSTSRNEAVGLVKWMMLNSNANLRTNIVPARAATIVDLIEQNTPFVMSISEYSYQKKEMVGHSVVCSGYSYEFTGSSITGFYAIVNDGHGSSGVRIKSNNISFASSTSPNPLEYYYGFVYLTKRT